MAAIREIICQTRIFISFTTVGVNNINQKKKATSLLNPEWPIVKMKNQLSPIPSWTLSAANVKQFTLYWIMSTEDELLVK